MSSNKSYSRKISKTEAENNFIFILKNKLPFFPPLGEYFMIQENGVSYEVMVESYPCTCRGPERPHEHYYIAWDGLEKGSKVEIEEDPSETNQYTLNRTHLL